jgi:hypothetical protein
MKNNQCPAEQEQKQNNCPVDKTPEFKKCQMCEDCVILRAWKNEFDPPLWKKAIKFFKKVMGNGDINEKK